MRLIGSLTEDCLREQLLRSNAALRDGSHDPALIAFLRERNVNLATAFILHWVPEQGEEICTVLDGDRQVLTIELSRVTDGPPPIVQAVPFAIFRESVSKRSRSTRLKFAVAMDLVSRASGASSGA